MEFFTIGVYNSTEEAFFEKLVRNKIDTFCDIRQRRGVRGAKYSFVNSNRLQEKLAKMEVNYTYVRDLAPSAEIREFQKSSDRNNRELKSERQSLAEVFVKEYKNRILDDFDFDGLFENLSRTGADRVVLFCVEENAEACHRSVVAYKLANDLDLRVTHL